MNRFQNPGGPESQPHSALSIRTMLIVLFAVVLLATAGVAQDANRQSKTIGNSSDISPAMYTTIQYDGLTHVVAAASNVSEAPAAAIGRYDEFAAASAGRPKYVEMAASLANFDSDADPDGWRVELVLLDQKDRPVITRANATFELMPRVATGDFYSYVDAARLPVRWSMRLDFDEDGVARIKLPLRKAFQPMFGWPSAVFPRDRIDRSRISRSVNRSIGGTWNSGTVVRDDWRSQLGRPLSGEIRVRVSVPTEGVFQAVTIVPIRPPALVDTHWPYR